MSTNDENQTPSAWVWSQYRGVVTGDAEGARNAAATTPGNRERPPLIPENSGMRAGPLAVALVLVAAGLTWWFSGARPAPETAPQETAAPADPAADAAAPADSPAAPTAEPSDAQAPAAQPAEAAPRPETEARPEPEKEHSRAKKKKKKH